MTTTYRITCAGCPVAYYARFTDALDNAHRIGRSWGMARVTIEERDFDDDEWRWRVDVKVKRIGR